MGYRFLLIEDDRLRASVMEQRLKARWPGSECRPIETEKQFLTEFDAIAHAGFDLAIIDQMLPYVSIDSNEPITEEALNLDAFRGGTRCYEKLQHDPRTEDRPVLFYTILDQGRVPDGVPYVQKSGRADLNELISGVEKLLVKKP